MHATKEGAELVLHPDVSNEQFVLAAAIVSPEIARALVRHPPDAFLVEQHRATWAALQEATKQGLPADPTTLSRFARGDLDVGYLVSLVQAKPDPPAANSLAFAVGQLLWDRQRHVALTGPVNALLEAIRDRGDPDRVASLARAVAGSFDGWGERKYLHDPEELARAQMADIRERMAGRAIYPYGLPSLDMFDVPKGQPPKRRMIPGAAPGQVTVITGSTESGKSTLAARSALGMARMGRRVLYCAWEVAGGPTLETIASMSLGWSRLSLRDPATAPEQERLTPERLGELHARMLSVQGKGDKPTPGWVRFMGQPFRLTAGKRATNDHHLDLVQGYLADSGCDVAIFDLWERCLVDDDVSSEKNALFRQQAMARDIGVHCVLLAQQKKEIALRPGNRPTVEGIKGSGAWGEVGDTVIGVHRQHLWKAVPDTVVELLVMKQRHAPGHYAIECDWDPDRGIIRNGRSIEYERPYSSSSDNPIDRMIREPKRTR